MLKKLKVDELYERFTEEMNAAIVCEQSSLKKMTAGIVVVQRYLQKLREFMVENPLEHDEEIVFFKEIKPKFYQWLIYRVELNAIESSKPFPDGKNIFHYYGEQLSFLNRFFRQNEFHYQYYKLGAIEMDSFYFIRGAEIPQITICDIPEIDPRFGTHMDYLFAKFMAYEMLQKHILNEMRNLSAPPLPFAEVPIEDNCPKLKWTGDKTNLVEVIYGLFYTGQLNSGNATVADIIKWMEHHLGIDLSRSYKNFIDIKNRKRDSPTKFLDKMKEFILQRIDEDNRYKPNRGIKLIEGRENK